MVTYKAVLGGYMSIRRKHILGKGILDQTEAGTVCLVDESGMAVKLSDRLKDLLGKKCRLHVELIKEDKPEQEG